MSRHTDDIARHGVDHGRGREIEKWILRSLLVSLLLLCGAAVVGSRDDIRRYARMRRM